jgi:hypothetical protein
MKKQQTTTGLTTRRNRGVPGLLASLVYIGEKEKCIITLALIPESNHQAAFITSRQTDQ